MTPETVVRLARAVHLDCERIGNGAWQVTGGANAHIVGEECLDLRLLRLLAPWRGV